MPLTNQGELVSTNDQERSLLPRLGAIYAAVIEYAGWKNIFCQLAVFFKVDASAPVCSPIAGTRPLHAGSIMDVTSYPSRAILAIALVCLLPYPVEAAPPPDACGPVVVIEPHTAKTSDSRPNLAWTPIPGASAYRIKLDSRIPEGEKVFSAEVQVSTTSFLPAKALTESRAHVRATITPICGTADGIPTVYQFDIDTASACGTDSNIRISNASGKRQLLWAGPKSAQSHNIWIYEADTGKLLSNAEVSESSWMFPDDLVGPAIIAIRPKCAAGQGMFSYLAF
jgi:hypothetical protein